MKRTPIGSAGNENHQQEDRRTGSSQEEGHSAREMPVADREPTNAGDLIFNLSLASQDKSVRSILRTREANDSGEDRIGPRAGEALNNSPPIDIKGAEGASKARGNPTKTRGIASKINERLRPEIQRTRSGGYLRRSHSAKVLKLPRDGRVVTKKRQGTERPSQEAATAGTDLESQKSSSATETQRSISLQKRSFNNQVKSQTGSSA